ncbi:MAG: type II secretion system protein [Anaerohalosphaeraceae bacterium]
MFKGLNRNGRKAFTLIELLVVIAVIGLLMAIILPALQKAKRSAKETICCSNLHQLSIAALAYENDEGRLPEHYAENPGGTKPRGAWSEQIASNTDAIDHRPLWLPYIPDLKFMNCPLLKTLDINIEAVPLNSHRVYSGYMFVFGYWRDRLPDGQWGAESTRWTKTNQNWKYNGRRVDVLAGDRLYYSAPNAYYRVNHGLKMGLTINYVDCNDARDYVVSVYESGVTSTDEDLRKKVNGLFCFKDGSAEKYSGSDDRLVDIFEPTDQSGREGAQLIPMR